MSITRKEVVYSTLLESLTDPDLPTLDKKYAKRLLKEYKEILCKEQRINCAEDARVFMPSHPHLHMTKNVNKEDILISKEPDVS